MTHPGDFGSSSLMDKSYVTQGSDPGSGIIDVLSEGRSWPKVRVAGGPSSRVLMPSDEASSSSKPATSAAEISSWSIPQVGRPICREGILLSTAGIGTPLACTPVHHGRLPHLQPPR